MSNLQTLKPFKPGYDARRHIKQVGEVSFKKAFEKAVKWYAKQTGKKVNANDVIVQIIAKGIKKALRGDYKFCKDLLDRLYGKAKQTIETDIDKPLLILPVVDKIKTEDVEDVEDVEVNNNEDKKNVDVDL
jgi:hypothetical protein